MVVSHVITVTGLIITSAYRRVNPECLPGKIRVPSWQCGWAVLVAPLHSIVISAVTKHTGHIEC
jgi:hypothetical protein